MTNINTGGANMQRGAKKLFTDRYTVIRLKRV